MSPRLRAGVSYRISKDRVDRELFRLVTEITNEINWQLREGKLTRVDLADRMGVSPGRISQVLSGDENLTLRTLAALAAALDARFEVQLRPVEPAQADDDPALGVAPPATEVDGGRSAENSGLLT